MNQLVLMLDKLYIYKSRKNVVLADDFNFFTDTKLETMGGSPALKTKPVAKLIGIQEAFELCDTWRIQNPSSQRYTFRQNHFSDLRQQRLYYTFLLNSLQDFVSKIDTSPALSTHHYQVTLTTSKLQLFTKGNCLGIVFGHLIAN